MLIRWAAPSDDRLDHNRRSRRRRFPGSSHRVNIVLTGASSGIGRALAVRLLSRGDRVWGIARSAQSDFAANYPDHFRFSRCDVSHWSEIESAATTVAAEWPHVDAVVTCAGIQGEIGRALSADPIRWSNTVRANLDGTYFSLRAFAPLLERSPQRRKIVCFSGGGATKARENFSAYGTAKTAVVRLVETIAAEEASRPLDINAIAPGAINTRLTDEVITLGPTHAGAAEYEAALQLKKAGEEPLERALALMLWLLSPASDGITGRLISAPWDPWRSLPEHASELANSDIYTLRRIVPEARGKSWDQPPAAPVEKSPKQK
jgi:NAD(P)-dependent dehydrogenase (short-subunit alcohol dehydrogenase family)